MKSISDKLQKIFVKTKNGQKEFIVFKKIMYPFKILKGESCPIFDFVIKPKKIFLIQESILVQHHYFIEH